jgi:hypothetical protein
MTAQHTPGSAGAEKPPKPAYRCTLKSCPKPLLPWHDKAVWVAWTYVLKNGHWTKVPLNPNGRPGTKQVFASTADPKTWGTFDDCLQVMQRHDLAGVGIVLGPKASGLSGGDLDDCLIDGRYNQIAADVLGYGEGAYIETSPSGTGLKFLTTTKVDRSFKRDDLGIELYGGGRFFTITGEEVVGSAEVTGDAPKSVARLVRHDQENPKPGSEEKPNGHHKPKDASDFFANVNAMALARLDAWVPVLHPTAKKQATGAWRIKSRNLARNLQEDLSYHPTGIKDHGEEVGHTAIDAVLKYGAASDAIEAAQWLCRQMGLEPAALGWRGNGAHHSRKGQADSTTNTEPPSGGDDKSDVVPWPTLDPAALYGIAGELAKLATDESEADPVAVLATTLVLAGAHFGRSRWLPVGDDRHHARLFAALVGDSSRARKGTSAGPVQRVFAAAESHLHGHSTLPYPSGLSLKISHGPLSTGEGLADAIRDKRDDDDEGGTDDKRLFVLESELGAALRAMQRQGNTLGTALRSAWDGTTLAPMTKTSKVRATNPHVAIVAHITREELRQLLTSADLWGGTANRFLWMAVRRSKRLPEPRAMGDGDVARLGQVLGEAIKAAHERATPCLPSPDAATYWREIYDELTEDYQGVLGAATSRAESQTLRLALTYALLDQAEVIEMHHLRAAHAVWSFALDSARMVFGKTELDPVAQAIIEALKTGPKTQTEIYNLFGRHKASEHLAGVLASLQNRGRITLQTEKTAGRPRQVWVLVT